ncbi:MAG: Holliday junction resolvase RuvX [Chthonomonadaceae bacterium]|nr:Holliday junction resolvase RuvX [Chthonomonadaceae bacterium]
MSKILALDVGEKTIGIALSDNERRYALQGETIRRNGNPKEDMATLRELILKNDITEIVVGLPTNKDGTKNVSTERVETFVAKLRGSVRIPIHYEDETLTTWEATQEMLASGKKREVHKATIDSVAAVFILEAFLHRPQSK